jgi:hypothetical protein
MQFQANQWWRGSERERLVVTALGVALILAVGAIHLVTAPDQFNDAMYKGVLFLANAAGAVVAAVGIWRSQRWAWILGVAFSVLTAAGYVLSRTVGLPGLPDDPNMFEPLGVAAVVCELAFIVLGTVVLARNSSEPQTDQVGEPAQAV